MSAQILVARCDARGTQSMRQRGSELFSPSRMVTLSSGRPAADQGPNISRGAEASGPINAM